MANELIGFASLPADTFAEGPQSGADDGEGNPIEANGRTGPFDGQPVQGFSGVQFAPDNSGALWFLSDNGFGAQENSTDYLLRIYQADPDFAGAEKGDGSVEVQNFVQLSDPDKLIPFNIVNENSEERLLTGSDFDIESFVFDSNGDIWVGDEFGPYLLHFDRGGTLIEAPIPTPNIPRLNTLNGQDPLVIGHRGASGLLPEHTLEAYRVAIAQGADFIEPDLVSTKDGVLIARHEPILDDTTNVAEVFGEDRMSTKILDGEEVTAYFAEDFTLAEIKQLRAVQQNDFRSQEFNGAFEIPTFQEVIELVQEVEAQTGVQVGIYPETKHPTYFDLQDLSPEESLIETLQKTGFTNPNRIFIQSFEFENLIKLQGMLDEAGLGDIPLVQLYGDTTKDASPEDGFSVPYDIRYNLEQGNDLKAIYGQEFLAAVENGLSEATTYRDMDSAEFLQVIADLYAEGAGPWKNNILLRESLEEPVDGNDDGEAEITTQLTGEITSFIDDAHTAGLQVHPYTLRNEEQFLTLEADGTPQTPEREFEQLIQIGADGFFTDFPGTGDKVRDAVVADLVKSPQNPTLGEEQLANLNRSQGFEGMAFSPDNTTLYPLLEGPVLGDPDNALRIYKFDPERSEYSDELVGYYPTEDSHPIGDFTPINENEFLVIERDNNEGEEAEFKKIFKIDFSKVDENGFVAKEEVVDLLNIADPNDLNEDGKTSFSFPFVTIEDVVVVDEDTILVANDNNYPFSMGREGDIDNNEVILIDLNKPLNIDSRIGENPMTTNNFAIDSGTTSVFLDLPLLESAAGLSFTGAKSEGEPFSDKFQVGFPITEETDFSFEIPFAPVGGAIEHSGTVSFALNEGEITLGNFSIGYDPARVSETASGFFVADTLEDSLGLEILFDVGAPGKVSATPKDLKIAEADLLLAPEFAEALELSNLSGADVGDTRIDASVIPIEEKDAPKAKNVIIMIGDGMGWEMARAAAIQKLINEGDEGTALKDFYTEGTGSGLSFQELEKYGLATTTTTYIDGSKDNSALEGDTFDHVTGESELREGFEFSSDAAIVEGFSPAIRERINGEVDADGNPLEATYDPELGFNENPILDANGDPLGGNLPIYDLDLGGAYPWEQGADPEYIKNLYPDSANTATTLYTGEKTYSGAIGVDVFEETVETLGERAEAEGKSFGIVSSVPFSHATPAAAAAHVNDRNKYHDDSVVEVAQNGDPVLDKDGNPIPAEVDEFGHPIPDTDNIFRQIVEETQPAVVLGGGHPAAETEFNYISEDGYNELVNGEYDDVYTFLERGPNAGQTLLETAAEIDPDNSERLFGLYGARGQSGNLPWSTANGDYSNTGLTSRTDAERPLEEGETVEEFIATEKDENPTLKELTQASLDVLGDDDQGFWVTIEGGDIDWSAHDNNLDNMLGTTLDFAESVGAVQDWIENNGGYEENLLIVTADHDHYFTLNEDFPELLRTKGAEALTTGVDDNGDPLLETNDDGELAKVDNEDPQASGHYWGSDPNEKYGWGTHTTRPVPVYYQGAGSEYLDNAVGQGFESYGQQVPGIDGYIDQVHIAEAQFNALGM
ncbi:esterase-like activity of phytase family protein [Myxosarcina sp. GI1]|uniref:esterase-like activity of phytase family protein n=1 Tax=Myxosarcina sp. GI1 TaxID=1541065 RepID=UPI00209E1313|nr:esterase-like activity of phytase family protein [Myxosarcina sp. GI1]